MATVDILIIVDVEEALADISNNSTIANAVYMVDTNAYMGSGGEGTNELVTVLNNGDVVQWTVVPIQPSGQVSIQGFTTYPGAPPSQVAIPTHINPVQSPISANVWESRFATTDSVGTRYQYSVVLNFQGKSGSFDPFLQVGSPPTS